SHERRRGVGPSDPHAALDEGDGPPFPDRLGDLPPRVAVGDDRATGDCDDRPRVYAAELLGRRVRTGPIRKAVDPDPAEPTDRQRRTRSPGGGHVPRAKVAFGVLAAN